MLGPDDQPFQRLLQTSCLSRKNRQGITRRLVTEERGSKDFWASLETEAGLGSRQIDGLKTTFEVHAFTGYNTALSAHLRASDQAQAPRDVAAISLEKWRDDVLSAEGVTIPDYVLPGQPEPARREAYARMLYRSAERQYPTAALAAQAKRGNAPANGAVAALLTKHPEFEFAQERVVPFLTDHPRFLKELPDPEAGRKDLLRYVGKDGNGSKA